MKYKSVISVMLVIALIVCAFSVVAYAEEAHPDYIEGSDRGHINGTGVYLRSEARIPSKEEPDNRTCWLNNGTQVRIVSAAGYANGYHWTRIQVESGPNANKYGYVASQYISYDIAQ